MKRSPSQPSENPWVDVLRDAWRRMSDAERVTFLAEQEGFLEELLDRDDRAVALIDALIKGKAA